MPNYPAHILQPPFADRLPSALFFRVAAVPAHASYPTHQHVWGEFVYAYDGLIEVQMADAHYLVPPQYGIWLPPGLPHTGLNHGAAVHASFYVSETWCHRLPKRACALSISPLVRAILDHLRSQPLAEPPAADDLRLMEVLVDQLAAAPCAGSYLPMSADEALGKLLRGLEANPGDDRPLAVLAAQVNISERTLIRRCWRDLGMSFSEWRQRLKVIKSLPLLASGQTVETISFDLGYSSASAFISMFRRLMSVTPDEYRKQQQALRR